MKIALVAQYSTPVPGATATDRGPPRVTTPAWSR